MSRFFIACLFALCLVATAAAQETPIDLDDARRAFEAARMASDADGGRLWGVDLYGPVFADDWEVATGERAGDWVVQRFLARAP